MAPRLRFELRNAVLETAVLPIATTSAYFDCQINPNKNPGTWPGFGVSYSYRKLRTEHRPGLHNAPHDPLSGPYSNDVFDLDVHILNQKVISR